MKDWHWSVLWTAFPLGAALAAAWYEVPLNWWFFFVMGTCTGTNAMSAILDFARDNKVCLRKRD